jgi:predicted Fe-Mo cluster-binding NifX family protein
MTTHKKIERKSPSESATKFNVGTKKKGNDGNMWIIAKNKNGVKRWVKISGTKKSTKKSTKKQNKKTIKKDKESNVKVKLSVNTSLEKFWNKLASGKVIVVIYDSGNYKIISLPSNRKSALNKLKEYAEDDNVKAILTSNMSYEAYELLEKKSKRYGHQGDVIQILTNYRKYFKPESLGILLGNDKNIGKDQLDIKLYYPY